MFKACSQELLINLEVTTEPSILTYGECMCWWKKWRLAPRLQPSDMAQTKKFLSCVGITDNLPNVSGYHAFVLLWSQRLQTSLKGDFLLLYIHYLLLIHSPSKSRMFYFSYAPFAFIVSICMWYFAHGWSSSLCKRLICHLFFCNSVR